MAAAKIGDARCPLCGGTARVSLSKKDLACLTCNACNCQVFARSDRSDQHVRDLIRPAAPAQAPAPAPASAPAPAPAPKPAAAPVTAPVAPPKTPAAPAMGGLLSGWFQ